MDCIIKNWFYIQFPRIYTKRQKKKIDNLHYSIRNNLFIYLTIIFMKKMNDMKEFLFLFIGYNSRNHIHRYEFLKEKFATIWNFYI